jgi:hypothetical protein
MSGYFFNITEYRWYLKKSINDIINKRVVLGPGIIDIIGPEIQDLFNENETVVGS